MSTRANLVGAVIALLLAIGAGSCADAPPADHPSPGPTPTPLPNVAGSPASPTLAATRAAPTATPTSTSTPTLAPEPSAPRSTATAPPHGSPEASGGITQFEAQGGPPGGQAFVIIQTIPGASCTLRFTPPGPGAEPEEIDPIRVNDDGIIAWQWEIAPDTPLGTADVSVSCTDPRAGSNGASIGAGASIEISAPPTPTPDPTAANDLRLAAVLGRLDELPTGWIVGNPDPLDSDASPYLALPSCVADEPEEPDAGADDIFAGIQFFGGVYAPFIDPVLDEYVLALDPGDAERTVERARVELACDHWIDDQLAPPAIWTCVERPVPALGEDALARACEAVAAATDETGGDSPALHVDIVVIREGGFFVLLYQYGFGALDSSVTDAQASAIMRRIEAAFPDGF